MPTPCSKAVHAAGGVGANTMARGTWGNLEPGADRRTRHAERRVHRRACGLLRTAGHAHGLADAVQVGDRFANETGDWEGIAKKRTGLRKPAERSAGNEPVFYVPTKNPGPIQ